MIYDVTWYMNMMYDAIYNIWYDISFGIECMIEYVIWYNIQIYVYPTIHLWCIVGCIMYDMQCTVKYDAMCIIYNILYHIQYDNVCIHMYS